MVPHQIPHQTWMPTNNEGWACNAPFVSPTYAHMQVHFILFVPVYLCVSDTFKFILDARGDDRYSYFLHFHF